MIWLLLYPFIGLLLLFLSILGVEAYQKEWETLQTDDRIGLVLAIIFLWPIMLFVMVGDFASYLHTVIFTKEKL